LGTKYPCQANNQPSAYEVVQLDKAVGRPLLISQLFPKLCPSWSLSCQLFRPCRQFGHRERSPRCKCNKLHIRERATLKPSVQQRHDLPVVLLEASTTIFGAMDTKRRSSSISHLPLETTQDPSAQIHAPFDRLTEAQLESKVEKFIWETGLSRYHQDFRKGAFLAQNDLAFDSDRDDRLLLLEEERSSLKNEGKRPWKHPRTLWALVILCAIGAATQGWDESAMQNWLS